MITALFLVLAGVYAGIGVRLLVRSITPDAVAGDGLFGVCALVGSVACLAVGLEYRI